MAGDPQKITNNIQVILNQSQLKEDVIGKNAVYLRQLQLKVLDAERTDLKDRRFQARKMLKLLNGPSGNHNTFSVGEFVLVKKFKKRKTDPSYDGPFIVPEVLDKNAYKLNDLNGNLKKSTYSLIHLRPVYQHYGSPLRLISDYSQKLGTEERKLFRISFEERTVEASIRPEVEQNYFFREGSIVVFVSGCEVVSTGIRSLLLVLFELLLLFCNLFVCFFQFLRFCNYLVVKLMKTFRCFFRCLVDLSNF